MEQTAESGAISEAAAELVPELPPAVPGIVAHDHPIWNVAPDQSISFKALLMIVGGWLMLAVFVLHPVAILISIAIATIVLHMTERNARDA